MVDNSVKYLNDNISVVSVVSHVIYLPKLTDQNYFLETNFNLFIV